MAEELSGTQSIIWRIRLKLQIDVGKIWRKYHVSDTVGTRSILPKSNRYFTIFLRIHGDGGCQIYAGTEVIDCNLSAAIKKSNVSISFHRHGHGLT